MSASDSVNRRQFLKLSSAAALVPAMHPAVRAATPMTTSQSKADYVVRIANAQVELAPGHVVSTTTYNGQFPGPLIRLTEGRRVVVDIQNDTGVPEQLHWHGQSISVDVDGAAEEGTPYIPAHGARRIEYIPGPTGLRFYPLDGNAVPVPRPVETLWIGTAERVSAIVEMNRPGVWVMGDLTDDDRLGGMGIVVQYAGASGKAQWVKPRSKGWDYTRFGTGVAQAPDETIELLFTKDNAALDGFNQWSINGIPFSMKSMSPMFHLSRGKRYRLRMRNASDDIHPAHLHRHSFELTRIAGRPTAGVMKDVVMLGGYQEIEVDFVANNPGRTLFHCHQQLHMDFGFMALFDYA